MSIFQPFFILPAGHDHQAYGGLLYAICPAAAKWWQAGVEPRWPFDPLMAALRAMAGGLTLKDLLAALDLMPLLPDARKYFEQVEAFRSQASHRNLHAPELLPTFLGARISLQKRHTHAAAFEAVGGWPNFFRLIRAWAFVIPDWKASLHMAPETGIVETRLTVAPGVDVQVWRFDDGKGGAVGLPVVDAEDCGPLLPALIEKALSEHDQLFLLDSFGRARRSSHQTEALHVERQIKRLAILATEGPYPPLRALNRPHSCRECGYSHLCWYGDPDRTGQLTSLTLAY